MAVGMLMQMDGGTQEFYDAVLRELDWKGQDYPAGFVSHYAGSTGGTWVVFDVWESREDFDRFAQERLMPALERASGGEQPPRAEPQFLEIYNEDHARTPAAA